MAEYREIDAHRDLVFLGEGLYRVSRDQNKAELCRCEVPGQHKASCIWWVAKKLGPEVRKAIVRLDLED